MLKPDLGSSDSAPAITSRGADGRWSLTEAAAGESFRVSALDGAISVDRVYAGVELTPRPAR